MYIADRHVRPSKAVQLCFRHGSSIACHRQCRLYFHVFIYTSIYLQYLWTYMYIPYWNVCSSASVSSLRFVESDDSVHDWLVSIMFKARHWPRKTPLYFVGTSDHVTLEFLDIGLRLRLRLGGGHHHTPHMCYLAFVSYFATSAPLAGYALYWVPF